MTVNFLFVCLMRGFIAGNEHHKCMSTCRMLSDRAEEYIRWPNQYSLEETASQFHFQGQLVKFVRKVSFH